MPVLELISKQLLTDVKEDKAGSAELHIQPIIILIQIQFHILLLLLIIFQVMIAEVA